MNSALAPINTQEIEAALAGLRETSLTIVVKDAPTCLLAKTAQRDVRNYKKDVHLKLDPFVNSAKRNLADAQDEINKWLKPAQEIDEALALKVKDYETQEQARADAETARINEERRIEAAQKAEADRLERNRIAAEERKAKEKELAQQVEAGEIGKREANRLTKEALEAEAREQGRAANDAVIAASNVVEVVVEAAIPKVAGVPSRRNWKFRITDESRIPRSHMEPNLVKIGADVREIKKAGEVISGIEAYLD